MIKCVDCGASQYEGALFCSECGRSLVEKTVQPTDVLPFTRFGRRPLPASLKDYKLTPETKSKNITFFIPGSRQRITVELVDQILVGRADFDTDTPPELDLTDYEGMERGVSRVHAALQLSDQGVLLSDLDSTNGTLLNNSPLPPEKPFILHSGDEIRFGDLLIHVFFEA